MDTHIWKFKKRKGPEEEAPIRKWHSPKLLYKAEGID